MELIKQIEINNPPTKYIDRKKTKIDPKTGRLKEVRYYLTLNLFFAGHHFTILRKITQESKRFLLPFMSGIPPLKMARIEVIYQSPRDNFDLDNKSYFWIKMFLDILKTPTQKQIDRAIRYKSSVITTNTLKDDTCKYIDEINVRYKKGESKLIIKIYGVI